MPIVLFDGVCGLCDASVKFIIDHDPAGAFRLAPLQSAVARQLLLEHHLNPDAMSSIVLIDGIRAYTRSTAALRIGRRLRPRILSLLALAAVTIPPPVRDTLYDFIARNRYRWFGRRQLSVLSCPSQPATARQLTTNH